MRKRLPTFLSVALLLLMWQLAAMYIGYPALFPPLPDLLQNIASLFVLPDFYASIGATIGRGMVGFVISFITAFICALLSANSGFWKDFFHPILVVIRSVPVISLVLIALLWFSPNQLPVFIALLTMWPVLYQNTLNGLESTDERLVEMARVFGKTKMQRLEHIYLPSAKNLIFSGISTAMGFGWRAVIIGEVLSQPFRGIGTGMKTAQAYINISDLIAWTVVAILISYLFEHIIKYIGRIKLAYRPVANSKKQTLINNKEISLQHICKSFNDVKVLDDFSYTFDSSVVTCIKSPSGSGKSTLLKLIGGIEKADKGSTAYNDNYSFAYSFQDLRLLPWLTVFENVMFGINISKEEHKAAEDRCRDFIAKVGLSDHMGKYPHELSGGEQQRVGLVRALAAQSDVLLLDEPLTGLDAELKLKIIALLEDWIAEHKPLVIWATHENIMSDKVEIKSIEKLNQLTI